MPLGRACIGDGLDDVVLDLPVDAQGFGGLPDGPVATPEDLRIRRRFADLGSWILDRFRRGSRSG